MKNQTPTQAQKHQVICAFGRHNAQKMAEAFHAHYAETGTQEGAEYDDPIQPTRCEYYGVWTMTTIADAFEFATTAIEQYGIPADAILLRNQDQNGNSWTMKVWR